MSTTAGRALVGAAEKIRREAQATLPDRLREYTTIPLIGRGQRGRLIQDVMREAADEIERLRRDIKLVLANLHHLEEVTMTPIDGEDSIILRQIEQEHGMDITAERRTAANQ